MRFKVYVDWTTEEVPRAFYVGKGTDRRLRIISRNKLHAAIAAKHGFDRCVVFETDVEDEAHVKERELIAEHNTFVYGGGWGANFTLGGEGTSGHPKPHCAGETHPMFGRRHTEESKRKNSESNKVAQAGEQNGMFGKHHSEETRKKIGEKSRGRVDSPETRQKKSVATTRSNTGRKLSEETKRKIAEAHKGKPPWNKGLKTVAKDEQEGK